MDAQTPADAVKSLSHSDARLIVIGMMLPIFMGSIDQTILASALPAIGRDFGNVELLPWLITTYLIAGTATTPLFGKLSDIRGRRFAIMVAIVPHIAGSLVCALAPNMAVLIFGRVLLGIGGGGLISTGMIVLGDVAPPKERAKYYAYFSVTYTTAGALGPLLGGLFADHLHWTAIFWFNLPLEFLTVFFTLSVLRRLPRHERPHRLDILGALLIVAATAAFMLAVTSGGNTFAWTSAPIVGLFAVAAAVGGLFVLRLLRAPEPLIPLAILRDPVARAAIIANSFGWGGIIGLNIFLPIYLQNVLDFSATSAGLSLMVLMGALNASAGFASALIARHRRYKIMPLIGLGIAIAAVLVLAWQAPTLEIVVFECLIGLIALGFGPLAPLTGVALQNTVVVHQFGSAVGAMTFLRNLFATVLVAIFGAIVLRAGTGPGMAFRYQVVFLLAAASLAIAFIAMAVLEEKPLNASHSH